jgi:hypothetical protein
MGAPVVLAEAEGAAGAYTARLVSDDHGLGCAILFERWTRQEPTFRLSLEAVDTLLDALDDEGQSAFQRLAQLVVHGGRTLAS